MEHNGLNDIRKAFRDFYVSKGHYAEKSASLIPQDDNSLLIINSGMAPLKKYFSGTETPPAKRMTTCQKCIRTGDIDNVGKTSRHGTFFEMMGNFSFGDYFKEESLKWGWEFITKILQLPAGKIWATVYQDDEEAVRIWKSLGLPEKRIVRLGKEDNFWEIGLGPCGPDSEIFYDRGPQYGCGRPDCKPGCDCDRYVEFWNHVFTQFSKEEDGSYSNLAHPNIDTGMGLERIACIMQNVDSIFDIDTIRFILDGVLELSGVPYGRENTGITDVSVRIITDHIRSMVFMTADGILPSNEGRGYVLRRLIRRAARHGKLLGIKQGFLSGLTDRVIEVSGEAYPEIVEKRDYIKKIISVEEDRFAQTIDQGTDIIGGYIEEMKRSGKTVLDGEKMFKLYDTFGFPPELTEEILAENGFTADIEGFTVNMQRQKEIARSGRKTGEEAGWNENIRDLDLKPTEFTGYKSPSCDAHIIKVSDRGDGMYTVYFDRTPFYATSGGQVFDTGRAVSGNTEGEVISVTKNNGIFSHDIRIAKGSFVEGEQVKLSVDARRRNLIARNHTATHILHKALRIVVGDHVRQAGSYVDQNELRFDFTHFEALTAEETSKIEILCNKIIEDFIPVTVKEMPLSEAQKLGATALFGEKYGDVVRVVSCGGYSSELCGGTHVSNTGEIGAIKIVSESGIASGVRRIVAVTAAGLLKTASELESSVKKTCDALKCNPQQLVDRSVQMTDELRDLKKELAERRRADIQSISDDIMSYSKDIGGVRLICRRFDDAGIAELRDLSDTVKKNNNSVVMVFAAVNGDKAALLVSLTDDLTDKGLHAGHMIKEIAAACGGGGGGKANMAQAGIRDVSKIDEAFAVAENLLK